MTGAGSACSAPGIVSAKSRFLFAQGKGFFAFASEFKALLSLHEVSQEIDESRLLAFLNQPRLGLDDNRETAFTEIKQLLPGEKLTVDLSSFETVIKTYWQPVHDATAESLNHDDAVDRFRDILTSSVDMRMRSDVPVGSCLSGGLDSSSIVCLNRRRIGEDADYHVFTGRFGGAQDKEWPYAEDVIRATHVTSHLVEPSAAGFLDELPEFMWLNELPVGSSSQYAQWNVFRLAKETGVTVLLEWPGGG